MHLNNSITCRSNFDLIYLVTSIFSKKISIYRIAGSQLKLIVNHTVFTYIESRTHSFTAANLARISYFRQQRSASNIESEYVKLVIIL